MKMRMEEARAAGSGEVDKAQGGVAGGGGGSAGGPRCSNGGCGKVLHTPLQCARCKKAHYCSRDCQVAAWKGGHKRECVPAAAGGEEGQKSKGGFAFKS